MGTVVDSRRVAELPIPHGEPFKLIGLAGGVSYTRDPRLDRPFEPTHIVGYYHQRNAGQSQRHHD